MPRTAPLLIADDFLKHPLSPGDDLVEPGPPVGEALDELRDELRGSEFSDIIDAEGNQYVDLVLQGGGLLGIALVGYIYALEHVGLRFLNIAGSSAGAINAILLAGLGPPAEKKGPEMLDIVANLDPTIFLDGSRAARSASAAIARDERSIGSLLKLLLGSSSLLRRRGLHPGNAFHEWIHSVLMSRNVETWGKLKELIATPPEGLGPRAGRDDDWRDEMFPGELAIVAVDVATKSKLIFPRMAHLIFANPDQARPATFVRASMSIPWFFQPLERARLDQAGQAEAWADCAGYRAELPKRHSFVDGGMVSNFPIGIFHQEDRVPMAPTLGIRLGTDRSSPDLSTIFRYTGAAINAARQALDFDFLARNADYKHLIGTIDTRGYHWLNFFLTPEEKLGLFARGVEAARRFLRGSAGAPGFDWPKYKVLRANLAEGVRISREMKPKAADGAVGVPTEIG